MSNINLLLLLVRAFYDLALGCRRDVPSTLGAERPPAHFFAPPAALRGKLLQTSATKCSWPHSLSDRLGDVSKTMQGVEKYSCWPPEERLARCFRVRLILWPVVDGRR